MEAPRETGPRRIVTIKRDGTRSTGRVIQPAAPPEPVTLDRKGYTVGKLTLAATVLGIVIAVAVLGVQYYWHQSDHDRDDAKSAIDLATSDLRFIQAHVEGLDGVTSRNPMTVAE